MSLDQVLALIGLSRLPCEPKRPRPLWEENGFRVLLSKTTCPNGPRTTRYLDLERLENFVWTHVSSGQFLRHPCFSYDSKTEALRKLQAQAREAWSEGVRKSKSGRDKP
jgi:hypothetical protein